MVRAGADFSALRRQTTQAQRTLNNFQRGVNKTLKMVGVTISTVAIGSATKDAMKYEGQLEQVDRLLGQNAKTFKHWSNTQAREFGLSKKEAIEYGATYANLLGNFSKSTAETQQNTQKLLKSSSIIASKTGRTLGDVLGRIRSGLLGNTEAIEDLGVNVNVAMLESTEAFKKIAGNKSWNKLTFEQQQQIRLMAILEQSYKKYGDELSNNTSAKHNKFIAQLKDIKLYIGQAFAPIYNYVLPSLTRLASYLSTITGYIAQFTQALFGSEDKAKSGAQNTDAKANAVKGLGKAYQEAGKKAKGALAGFDEINSIDTGKASDIEGASGTLPGIQGGSTDIDFGTNAEEVGAKIKAMAQLVKTKIIELKVTIVENKDIIVSALAGIVTGFLAFKAIANWGAIIAGLKAVFAGLATALSAISLPAVLVGAAIAAVVGAIVYLWRTNEGFREAIIKAWNKIKEVSVLVWNKVKEASIELWNNVLVPFGNWLSDIMVKAWGKVVQTCTWLWKNVLVPFGQFLLWMWNNVFVPIGAILVDVLAVAFGAVSDVANLLWENVLIPLGLFFTEVFGPAVEAISAVFTFLWENVLIPLGDYLGNSFKEKWKELVKVLEFLWHKVLKPLASYLWGGFKGVLENVFKNIKEKIENMKIIFMGILKFITGIFTGDWQKAWEGVKEIFGGIFKSLYDLVKTPINLIISAINKMIEGLNSISIDIPDWVPGFGGEKWGMNIPKIPKLANGGITGVNKPFLAQVGDNMTQREVIAPLGDLQDIIAESVGTAMLNAMQFSNDSSSEGDVILMMNEVELGRVSRKSIEKENKRVGVDLTLQPT